MIKICGECKKTGSLTDFYVCSTLCKKCFHKYLGSRWAALKLYYLKSKGGCCIKCGYDDNYAALHFHHLDPVTKEKEWPELRLCKPEEIEKELQKCIILCSRCHTEHHNPQAFKGRIPEKMLLYTPSYYKDRSHIEAKQACSCGDKKDDQAVNCHKCAISKRRKFDINKEDLLSLIQEMPMITIGKMFGVSGNAVVRRCKFFGIYGFRKIKLNMGR